MINSIRSVAQLVARSLIVSAMLSPWVAAETADYRSKYNPGNYIAINQYDGSGAIGEALRPGVVGVQVRYSWSVLEPAKDVYDFSSIERDLAKLKDTGRQLVIFVRDKSFKDVKETPEYLWNDYTLPIRTDKVGGEGYVSKRWDPYVVERFSALMRALGQKFDKHPQFEGVAIQETALGLSEDIKDANGYTPEKYRDALILQLKNAAQALPNSRIFWYMNYLTEGASYLEDICDAVAPYGVAVGGPDLLPDSAPLKRLHYPLLRRLKGRILFNSAQYDSFRHEHLDDSLPTKYWTPQELLDFALDDLALQYIFWNRVAKPSPVDSYKIEDVYQIIAKDSLPSDSTPSDSPPSAPVLSAQMPEF